jgi:hypothetical protein
LDFLRFRINGGWWLAVGIDSIYYTLPETSTCAFTSKIKQYKVDAMNKEKEISDWEDLDKLDDIEWPQLVRSVQKEDRLTPSFRTIQSQVKPQITHHIFYQPLG